MLWTMNFCYLTVRYIGWNVIGMVVVLLFIHITLGPHNLEFLALSDTSVSVSNKFCICLSFLSPSIIPCLHFCTTLQIVNPTQFSTFLLLGDFNVNFLNPQHHLFSHLRYILYSFSLHQVVPSFIHISPNGNKSLIDLVLQSEPSCLQSSTTIPPLLSSDHLEIMEECIPQQELKKTPKPSLVD